MLKGAMDALVIGNPADLATDVSPVIDAVAHNKLLNYIEQHRSQVLHQVAVPSEHAQQGYFVPPTLIRVNGMEDLGEEQFGPIVHVATFEAGELNRVLDEINASGYGLTLGVHTRIERRANDIAARAHVGNVYVNRNQIGAVVGVQPFGGCGLSGTGPKAGGALYLRALVHATQTTEQIAPVLAWQAQWLDSPTGESNAYRVQARGRVLCLGPTIEDVRAQILIASATHNHAIVPHVLLEQTLRQHPELTEHTHSAIELSDTSVPDFYDFDAVAYFAVHVDDARAHEIRTNLANHAGAIIPLITSAHSVHEWVHEFHVCTDTTAAGGNAELLAHSV
jgi:RHH-type proline utilization regulon transcriptional repressor/proline dehydrogenase/delta 1-pyrroline-5-carboxylate dehydrogenase